MIKTVIVNSALKQNWVGCTVRTPKAQVTRTLHAQCPCRGRCCAHSQRRPRAQRAQAARIAPRSWAHVATSLPCPVKPPRSRHRFQVATSWRPSHVATSHWCRDTAQPAPGRDFKFDVATPSLLPSLKPGRHPMSRHHIGVGPPGRPTCVATSTPCRDILKINLCRDLPD